MHLPPISEHMAVSLSSLRLLSLCVDRKRLLLRGLQRDVVYLGPDLVYEPKCGGSGGVAGSQPMSTGAQINFGGLTPYLTYAFNIAGGCGMEPTQVQCFVELNYTCPWI